MTRETKVPSIPDVREDNVLQVLSAIKATLEVREGQIGDPLDQGATLRDLVALNIAGTDATNKAFTDAGVALPISPVLPPLVGSYDPTTDYTTPPQPTNLIVSGGVTNVYLQWDGAPYRNHNYTEIWRSEFDVLGTAIRIGTTAANVYADAAAPNKTYYYWIRFVSVANVVGPYNLTGGTSGTTALNVAEALGDISDSISSSQLFIDLGTRVGNAQIAVEQQTTIIDGLSAQYTVKIDNNGYVTGYGLASTAVNGAPQSTFLVRADTFSIAPSAVPAWSAATTYSVNDRASWIVNGDTKVYRSKLSNNLNNFPSNTTYWENITEQLPFTVLTTPTVIDGLTYPAGTYIKTAFIADATIASAKIQSLVADKITTGSLSAAIGVTTGRITGGVNTAFPFGSTNFGTGFYLGNDNSTYKFRVGSPTQNMTWDGTNLSVTGTVTATAGTFRGITIYNDSNQIILSSGSGINAGLLGLGNFAYLNQITSGNISTYIASAAIGDAYIANLAVTSAKIANLAVENGKIANLAVTEGKIASAAITNAKIGTAAVDTLNIAGEAVTVPRSFFNTSTYVGNGSLVNIINYTFTLEVSTAVTMIFSARQGYSSGGAPHLFEFYMDGVLFIQNGGDAINDYPCMAYSWDGAANTKLSAGSHTLLIKWRGTNSNIQLTRALAILIGSYR